VSLRSQTISATALIVDEGKNPSSCKVTSNYAVAKRHLVSGWQFTVIFCTHFICTSDWQCCQKIWKIQDCFSPRGSRMFRRSLDILIRDCKKKFKRNTEAKHSLSLLWLRSLLNDFQYRLTLKNLCCKHGQSVSYLFIYVWWDWAQGFKIAKQALYHLSHTSSPFCSGYFEDGGGLTSCLPKLASNLDPPDLNLLSS
jgi:hypothetical protein